MNNHSKVDEMNESRLINRTSCYFDLQTFTEFNRQVKELVERIFLKVSRIRLML